jgi:hypothetical protein
MSTQLTLVALILALSPSLAMAGGDTYDGANDTAAQGPAYFGFVKDAGGKAIAGAKVHLVPKNSAPVTLTSDVLGLYRGHIRKGVSPDDVVTSCEKDGFKQLSVYRRTPAGSNSMFNETDCTLQAQ